MAGAKSHLVVLFFLIVLATSQAENCKDNYCFKYCRYIGGSKTGCADDCNCSQLTFVPNELGRKVKTTEVVAATEMEVDYNRAEAVLDEMTMELIISLNHKLASKCKYQPCYRACRAVGGSKDWCAKKCNCTQVTDEPAQGTHVMDANDEASTAAE